MNKYVRQIKHLVVGLLLTPPTLFAANPAELTLTWPKTLHSQAGKVILYQPQAEQLDGNNLSFSMPIAVIPNKSGALSQFGLIKGQCHFTQDQQSAIGECSNTRLSSIKLPTLSNEEDSVESTVQRHLVSHAITLTKEQYTINLERAKLSQKQDSSEYKFKPPKIYLETVPTALVMIDGHPKLSTIPGTPLKRITNTSFVILNDEDTGQYYLRSGVQWMMSTSLYAQWFGIEKVPRAIKAFEETLTAEQKKAAKKSTINVEKIIISIKPAALLQTNGTPKFAPLKGTDLLYVSNTDNDIFMHLSKQSYYTLLSGRWFTTKKLVSEAHWTHVPSADLPATFAQISSDSVKAHVLVSVPGTPLAEEAVIKNQVPTTAIVKRSEASVDVSYDGEPQFQAVSGSQGVQYATNTRKAVFRVPAPGGTYQYYSNYRAIWFVAATPLGPWSVAVSVPNIIYTIPPSSPFYYVTFNYIYGFDPFNVYLGYTPGYLGSFIFNNALIFGTGYYYPGWMGSFYFGFPMTYGLGFSYNPLWGWFPGAFYANPWWFGAGLFPGLFGPFSWYNGWFGPLFFSNWWGSPFFYNNFYMLWGPNVTMGRIGFFYFDRALREALMGQFLRDRMARLQDEQFIRQEKIRDIERDRIKRQEEIKKKRPPIVVPVPKTKKKVYTKPKWKKPKKRWKPKKKVRRKPVYKKPVRKKRPPRVKRKPVYEKPVRKKRPPRRPTWRPPLVYPPTIIIRPGRKRPPRRPPWVHKPRKPEGHYHPRVKKRRPRVKIFITPQRKRRTAPRGYPHH